MGGVLRVWNGTTWADVQAGPFMRRSVWNAPAGWKWQAGSHTFTRVGDLVFFSGGEIGVTSGSYYHAASGYLDMGQTVPVGFRPTAEYKAHLIFMNGWGDFQDGFWGFRPDGTSFILSETEGTVPAVDMYHTLVIPTMSWITSNA